ncbi:MAG TPA: hypothetical protein VJR89_23940 [Polyangiales bacterium]|nr:hypothetical protein [Polyangiales bacterium]
MIGIAGATRTARADLADCGDISLEARAECTVVPPSAQCETMCTPISVRAACAARLAVDCDAGCNKLPSVECSGKCVADCSGRCQVDPGKFDCEAACSADCNGRCSARCESSGNRSSCMAECQGTCGVSCSNSCDVRFPSADCKAKCEAGCEGSCKVDTNLDCQLDCQAKGYAKCEADITGGCKTQCETKEGALFCDGQYIDHGDNLQMCIDSIKAAFDARVMAESSGEADCEDGTCRAEGEAKVSSDCSSTGPGAPAANLWALFALVGAMLAYMLRVRTP